MVNKSITSIIAQIVYVDCLHNGFANISLILLTVINCYMALTYSICLCSKQSCNIALYGDV